MRRRRRYRSTNLFKNWVVGCDNVRICEATGLATEADAPDGSDIPMAVTRAGGPDGELKVLIEAGVALDPASLKLDGKPLPPALLSILKPDPQSHGAALTSTDAAAADFLRSIRDGTRADHRLGRPDRHNAGVAAGPGGARVADRRTCRAGSAARRPWPGRDRRRHPMCRRLCSCHPLPPAPPRPPELSEKTAKKLTAALRASVAVKHDCDNLEDDASSDGAVMLNKTQALVSVVCAVGAYRKIWHLFLVPPRPAAGGPATGIEGAAAKGSDCRIPSMSRSTPATGRLEMDDPCGPSAIAASRRHGTMMVGSSN
ncbi:MAG: DUF1176 domain-containing protein [Pseudomonadota bacterium]